MLSALLLLGACGSDEAKAERAAEEQAKVEAKELAKAMKKVSTITQDEFNKLEKGMTFEEEIKTIGGKPEEEKEISGNIIEYRYKGENGVSEDSKADLLFVNEKLDTLMERGLVKTESAPSPVVTKPVVKQGESLQTYIDETLEPLVRSVSTNIDLNWGFYMLEPFKRLQDGGSIESFHSDIELLDSLYTGTIKQIDESETPAHFSEKETKDINTIKTELKNSINKRIEVIDILLEVPNREEALNTDTLKVIEKSNEHLQKAVQTYMALGK